MALVTCDIQHSIATITMDDGQKNVMSPQMIKELNRALDLAQKKKAVVVITGREDVFCAGFDLKILKKGVTDTFAMLTGGFELGRRLLSFPTPVIIACNGHAIAMGAFLLLSGDYCFGATGEYKIVTNEVAIGLTMPFAGVEICRQRLNPAHFVRATLLAETYSPQNAVEAGFLDKVIPKDQLLEQALELARELTHLDMYSHYRTKLRVRKPLLKAMKKALLADRLDFVLMGVKRMAKKKKSKSTLKSKRA